MSSGWRITGMTTAHFLPRGVPTRCNGSLAGYRQRDTTFTTGGTCQSQRHTGRLDQRQWPYNKTHQQINGPAHMGACWSIPAERLDATVMPPAPEEPDDDWEWMALDLSKGGAWYNERVTNLKAATANLSEGGKYYEAGLEALEIHRRNYEGDGEIHQLQILWWEFPPEHWQELRDGCPMNFMTQPPHVITPNAPMTDEQVEIAAEFIDELWHIGVFELIPDGCEMLANVPLFTIPKPGQPGQWRVIADMKNGGQNDHIGKDPVHLPKAAGILEKLYTGGWSAIMDASKFFHNFPMHPHDRPYLGCIHPKTGQRLWYLGLPMGSSQSPALACRFGLSILRSPAEQEPVFQGTIRENGWRSRLAGQEHEPELGCFVVSKH